MIMGIYKKRIPLSKGVAKVPVIMQMEAVECGAACLTMVFAYYGRFLPLEKVREECGVSRDGSNLKNMYLVAVDQGFETRALRLNLDRLKERATFPCIVFADGDHFIVLNGIRNGRFYVNDPARGIITLDEDAFARRYSGVCLIMSPTEKFSPCGRPASIFDFVSEQLKGAGNMVALVLLTALISTMVKILLPAIDRFFVDIIMITPDMELGILFYLLVLSLVGIQITALWIQAAYMTKLQGKMSIKACTGFVWHLMSLPCRFYEQRMSGDLLERYNSNQNLSTTIITNITPVVLDVASIIFYAAIMFTYSPLLATIGIISVLSNLFLSRFISNKRINIARVMSKQTANLNVATISAIEMIETIKASGVEKGFFQEWANYYGDYTKQNMNLAKLEYRVGQIPDLITSVTTNLVIIIGAIWVMKGNWTIGILVAFNAYLNSFITPARSAANTSQLFMEMRTEAERVQDVMQYSPELDLEYEGLNKDKEYRKLGDTLEMKHITFGYNRLLPPILEDFSFSMKAGMSVAIVGGSGSGKSTVAKLLAGIQKPWSGEILIDNTPISEIPREVLASSLSFVTQSTTFFEDRIVDNLKMFDNTIENYEIIMASRDVQIHEDIIAREGGYQAVLQEGGRNFSGGQRQRLSIARALANDPRILVLDEATAALDAETEFNVMKAIHERGITTLVISHRLSIIRDCDEIIVLKEGKIENRGKHEYLMENCKYYSDLITSE